MTDAVPDGIEGLSYTVIEDTMAETWHRMLLKTSSCYAL